MRRYTKTLLAVGLSLALVAGTAVACDNSAVVSFFPVLSQQETVYPSGDASGKLVLEDGYLLLRPVIGDSHLLVWPYGYSIETVDGEIQVLDGDGGIVAVVGETIEVGGGEISAEIVEKYIDQALPEGCEGPYWIVSEVIAD